MELFVKRRVTFGEYSMRGVESIVEWSVLGKQAGLAVDNFV